MTHSFSNTNTNYYVERKKQSVEWSKLSTRDLGEEAKGSQMEKWSFVHYYEHIPNTYTNTSAHNYSRIADFERN